MDDDVLLAALTVEAGRVAAIHGDDVDIDMPVAACPGWGVGRLVGHLGRVHRWATALLQADPPAYVGPDEVGAPPRDIAVFDWYRDGLPPLFEELGRLDLDRPAFSWAGEQDRRWWLRRLTHETAVHRVDVQHALSVPEPVDGSVAVDGIDELFEVFIPARFDPAAFCADGRAGQKIHLHCTDEQGEWLARIERGEVVWRHEHTKGDVAVRGTASDLYLVLWNRLPVDRCEVFGDPRLFDRFLDAASF